MQYLKRNIYKYLYLFASNCVGMYFQKYKDILLPSHDLVTELRKRTLIESSV